MVKVFQKKKEKVMVKVFGVDVDGTLMFLEFE